MEEQRSLLREAFGDSSDSESDSQEHHHLITPEQTIHQLNCESSLFGETPIWERFPEINGLWLCRDFLDLQQQSLLLSEIDREGWFTDASHNQAMRFGNLPAWATELSNSIKEVIQFGDFDSQPIDKATHFFPSEMLQREPLFDQLIFNIYQPGEGICAHVDLVRFEDGIAIVSLESSCVMHFSLVAESRADNDAQPTKVPVYLPPGSLVLLWGEARYHWKHEINRKPGNQIWEGKNIDQRRRTSITLRKLCRTE